MICEAARSALHRMIPMQAGLLNIYEEEDEDDDGGIFKFQRNFATAPSLQWLLVGGMVFPSVLLKRRTSAFTCRPCKFYKCMIRERLDFNLNKVDL